MKQVRIQLTKVQNDKWAVCAGRGKYYSNTARPTKLEATIEGLKVKAREYQEKADIMKERMDAIHAELKELGAVDSSDPYGYLA
jgi:hypothetical protein